MRSQTFPPAFFGQKVPLGRFGQEFLHPMIGKLLHRKESGMGSRKIRLTERQRKWLWEYTRPNGNASKAARIVYGGTPISVRVNGYKMGVELEPILNRIDKICWDGLSTKSWDEMDRDTDAYI